MPIPQFKARVARIRDLTHDVRELHLHLLDPSLIDFKAGQFISFKILRKDHPVPTSRPYSIASPPSLRGSVMLVFNLVQGGPGSTFLYSLKDGDEVNFSGPAGAFYLHDNEAREYLFVATGTGIAPIRSMLYSLLERQAVNPITLYWGLRSERDLYYQDELEVLARSLPNFSFVITLSHPRETWAGERGRVTRLVKEHASSVDNLAVYLCGNSGLIKDVTGIIHEKGLCPIYREKFYDDAIGT
ncbi:MAG: FAD-binding oxidoreductase [Terriglobia bacterium]